MIEPDHPALPIGIQCRLLSISRSSFYYEPQGESELNLALMLLIDKQFWRRRSTASSRWPGICGTEALR